MFDSLLIHQPITFDYCDYRLITLDFVGWRKIVRTSTGTTFPTPEPISFVKSQISLAGECFQANEAALKGFPIRYSGQPAAA